MPYLGALAAVVILGWPASRRSTTSAHALLVPGSFLAVNLIQANLVTPMLLGHRLTLNPVAIFVGLTFFFWIWGVAGRVPRRPTPRDAQDLLRPHRVARRSSANFSASATTANDATTIREPAT